MIAEFSQSAEKVTVQTKQKHRNMIKVVSDYINPNTKILDIGEHNPFTTLIEERFPYNLIQNTFGDLDIRFSMTELEYGLVICSHVLEHLFNPLNVLLRVKGVLKDDGTLIVAVPQRTKLLWTKNHYHEIDDYRIRLLFKRAGFEAVKKIREKVKRNWWSYFTGVRAFLRLFLEYNTIYILRKMK